MNFAFVVRVCTAVGEAKLSEVKLAAALSTEFSSLATKLRLCVDDCLLLLGLLRASIVSVIL